ncbi:MAG: VWA domain-containing protein [Acidobacteria bacterium]|nr:VWA domain-containing protein [Acidobacteriota bacterium]
MRNEKFKMKNFRANTVVSVLLFAFFILHFSYASGQAGRRQRQTGEGATTLNVIATREGDSTEAITMSQVTLYENGVEQTVKSFVADPSPSRIVLLVDNSLTLRADVDRLEAAAREFAYEIFEGDKLLVVGYDNDAGIVADWTDDAKKLEASLKAFRKQGEPHLFDALNAVANEALLPLAATSTKRVIVVISDGLDRGSKTKFEETLNALQAQDITVYLLQAPDRTGGALRRDQPKPTQVIEKLAEGTGGRVFPVNEPRTAAAAICDELRKNRYILSYFPSNASYLEARRLLIVTDNGINVRSKTFQPPAVK